MTYSKMAFTPGSAPILTIMTEINNCKSGGLDLHPTYQRDFIWNDDFKNKLLYSIMRGYPIGAITIRNLGNTSNQKGARREVIDGQQRLTTIYEFYKGDYNITSKKNEGKKIVKKILNLIKDMLKPYGTESEHIIFNKLKCENPTISYKDLPNRIKEQFIAFSLATIIVDYATDEETAEYFSFLQNQERLRAGELINAIPETKLKQYYDQIYNIDNFFKIFNYDNDRKEFEKIFYSIIGIFDNKISLGTTDKKILKYVSEKKQDLSGNTLILTNNMVKNINFIIEKSNPTASIKITKRYLKFLFLLAGFNFLDFEKDAMKILRKLENIDAKLASFGSPKKGEIEKKFNGFSDSEIEDYRNIYLITKGQHNFNTVLEKCKILSEKIKTDDKI